MFHSLCFALLDKHKSTSYIGFKIGEKEPVSCYFRHLKEVFAEAGITVTAKNRNEIDRFFHRLTGVEHNACPATWKKLKQEWLTDTQKHEELISRLKRTLIKD